MLRELEGLRVRQRAQVVVMPVVRRPVVVLSILPAIRKRMMRMVIRHTPMIQGHMSCGKEPAEQEQKSNERSVGAHGVYVSTGSDCGVNA